MIKLIYEWLRIYQNVYLMFVISNLVAFFEDTISIKEYNTYMAKFSNG